MTKIILNGREVEADPSKPLIAACHADGVAVPHYCYHPGLTQVGSCRMCQVEVQAGKMPARVVASCRTPISEGMVVNTEVTGAQETRRSVMEFLLKNHPLDCPICDKAGECSLQDYAWEEGQTECRTLEPRQKEEKRHDLGDVIVLDRERCILCSRCVRFFEEIPGKQQLVIAGRGAHSFIDTFGGKPLEGNYQGNVADLCPVGALTLKPFRFQARVWNLLKSASTCAECSRGCSTSVEVLRRGDVKRFRPRYNADVNQWWMCDHGRFAYAPANQPDRLEGGVLRGAKGLEWIGVDEALDSARNTLAANEKVVVVASPFVTVEEGAALKQLCEGLGASPLFISPPESELKDDLLHTGDPCPNRRGLAELGFEAIESEALHERLKEAQAALLVGERVAALCGTEALGSLPSNVRLVVLDTQALDVPAMRICIGVPNYVERVGSWTNVDGHVGRISAARPAPLTVRPTLSLLAELCVSKTDSEVVA